MKGSGKPYTETGWKKKGVDTAGSDIARGGKK